MEIPSEFETHSGRNKACLLKKDFNGFKQSPRVWFGRFRKGMVSLGYKQSQVDHTLYSQKTPLEVNLHNWLSM